MMGESTVGTTNTPAINKVLGMPKDNCFTAATLQLKSSPMGTPQEWHYTFVISGSQQLELLFVLALRTKPQMNNPKSWL